MSQCLEKSSMYAPSNSLRELVVKFVHDQQTESFAYFIKLATPSHKAALPTRRDTMHLQTRHCYPAACMDITK